MVQIYDLDSDTEGLQLARGLDDDGAVFTASSDATHGIRMTPKIPPSFDGTTSWFEYEDLIDDWLGITTLTPRKHGPSLSTCTAVGPHLNKRSRVIGADPGFIRTGVTGFMDIPWV